MRKGEFLIGAAASVAACSRCDIDSMAAELAELEYLSGGRLGVCIYDFSDDYCDSIRPEDDAVLAAIGGLLG